MSDKNKIPQGPVSVSSDSDITPITRKPIEKINANDWESMNYEKLSDQYFRLQNRINMAMSMGRPDLAKQMQNGMKYITHLLEEKKPSDETSFL